MCAWCAYARCKLAAAPRTVVNTHPPSRAERSLQGCCSEGPPGGGELGAGTRGPITKMGAAADSRLGHLLPNPLYCLLDTERAKASRAHESVIRTKMCNVHRALIHHLLLQSNRDHEVFLMFWDPSKECKPWIKKSLFFIITFFFFFFPPKLKYVIFWDILKLKGMVSIITYQEGLTFAGILILL